MLAIMVGVVFLVARFARLGWIADYFSQAVLVGYITGVAIVLILGQLGKLLGISSDEDGAISETLDILRHVGDANGATVLVGVVVHRPPGHRRPDQQADPGRAHPRGLGHRRVVGTGPRRPGGVGHGPGSQRTPGLEIPDVTGQDVSSLVVAALAVFLVAFSDSILTRPLLRRPPPRGRRGQPGAARIRCRPDRRGRHAGHPGGHERVPHRGQRRHGRDQPGERDRSAATIAAILMFLTAPIEYLPSAVLGAVIVYAGAKLIDADQWRDLARSSRVEVVIAAITVVCVVHRRAPGDRRGRGPVGR